LPSAKTTRLGRGIFWLCSLVVAGVVRVLTNPRIFAQPMPLDLVLDNFRMLLDSRLALPQPPGKRHFDLFSQACRAVGTTGNLASEAQHAAVAIENRRHLLA